ncbi:protein artichoke-like [Ischnura elegans]|uniref:protein artichoke-like n=1 Tax=Ischnura elegans TaxID=197161 RepID=UPI001ED8BFF3|nr:protein artichoke-like [Ischnura elegans]
MLGPPRPFWGRLFPWFLLALTLLGRHKGAWGKGLTLPCPPKGYDVSEISPCKCRLTIEDYLQVWCSGAELEALTRGLAAVALWRGTSPVDELVVEGGTISGLPGRAFSPLRVRRLLMHRSGLERVSSAALLGLEGSLVELMLVEPRLRSLPADLLDMLPRLEALTIDVTDTQDGSTAEGDAFPGRPLSVPLLGALPSLRYLRISAPTTSGLSGMFPPRDPQVTLPALLSLSVHGGWAAAPPGAAATDDALWSALSFFATCCGGVEELLLDGNGLRLGRERVRVDAMSAPRGGDVSLRSLKILDISDNPLGRSSDAPSADGGAVAGGGSEEVPPQTQWLLDGAPSWVLPALAELRADRASLSVLPEGAVQSLPRLERLSLEGNAMRSIGPDAFYDLPSLLELRLRDNFLSEDSMPPPPYRRRLPWTLPALKGLDLSKNMLRGGTSLRRLLSGTPSIRRLDLSDNAISSLADDSFAASPLLEFVDLSGNPVLDLASPPPGGRNTIPRLSFLKPLSRLYELRISGAPTTPYSSSSADLPLEPRMARLRQAPVGGGSFPALPPLPGVEVLVASGMGIRRLYRTASRNPPPFSNALLPRLTSLDLSRNELTVLDTGAFAGVSSTLSAVDLSRNRLAGVLRLGPPLPLKSLRKLDVSENLLEAISVVTSASTPELKVLNASGNSINSLEMALPSVLGPTLEVLDLSRNSMINLPEDPLKPFVSLTELWLDGNGICSISGRPFDSTPRLRILSLRHNRLATLSPTPFRRFLSSAIATPYSSTSVSGSTSSASSLSQQRSHALLNLEGNPLLCSCRLLWLQEWLQEMEVEGDDEEEEMKRQIRCKDGTPLHQKRLSRKDCQRQLSTSALISSRGDPSLLDDLEIRDDETSCRNEGGSKAHASPSQELLSRPLSSSSLQQQQPPLPEESEYFYDQYVEEIHPTGPVGNTGNNAVDENRNGHFNKPTTTTTTTTETPSTTTTEASNDYIPGDTPTIYAGTRPKNESSGDNKEGDGNAGNSSGISIFGIPIPSWSSLFGSGKKRAGGTAKVARVNGPPRGPASGQSRRRGNPKVIADRNSIAHPKLESGFRPIFPGSGGFVPITGKLDTPQDVNGTQNRGQWSDSASGKPIAISHLTAAIIPSKNTSAVSSPEISKVTVTSTSLHRDQKARPTNTVKPFDVFLSPDNATTPPNRNGQVKDKLQPATEPTGVTGPFPSQGENLGRFPTKWTGTRAIGTVERVELKKNVGIEVGAVGTVATTNRGLKGSVGKAIMVIDDSDSDSESAKTESVQTGLGSNVHLLPEIITVRGGLLENVDQTNFSAMSTVSYASSVVVATPPPTRPWENFPSVVLQTTTSNTQSMGKDHVAVHPVNESNDVITEEFTLPTTGSSTENPKEINKYSVEPQLNSSLRKANSTVDSSSRDKSTKTTSSPSHGTHLSSYLLAPGGQAKVTKVSKTSQHNQQYSQQYEGEYYPHASQASVDADFHDIEGHKQDRTKGGIGYTKWPSEEHSKRSRLPEWYYANYNATEKDVYRGPLEDIIVTEGYPGFPSSSPGLHVGLFVVDLKIFVAIILTVFLNPVR